MIYLDDSLFIAQGRVKKRYNHPADSSLVVKVINGNPRQYKRYLLRTKREIKTLIRILKIEELKPYFPNFYGVVMTNMGVGFLFKKVTNYFEASREECLIQRTVFLSDPNV